MKISAELTLTPLKEDFELPIKAFIKALRTSGFTILENPLSTQIYGDYDALMGFLTQEIKTVFEQEINSANSRITSREIKLSDRLTPGIYAITLHFRDQKISQVLAVR